VVKGEANKHNSKEVVSKEAGSDGTFPARSSEAAARRT